MQEFLNYLLVSIVKNPDDVSVEESVEGNTYVYRLHVNADDMGLVIGKEGRIIRSIRALARSKAIKEGIMINVELVEPEGSTRGRNKPEIEVEITEPEGVEASEGNSSEVADK